MTPEELTALAWEKVKDVKTNWKFNADQTISAYEGGFRMHYVEDLKKRKKRKKR